VRKKITISAIIIIITAAGFFVMVRLYSIGVFYQEAVQKVKLTAAQLKLFSLILNRRSTNSSCSLVCAVKLKNTAFFDML